MPFENRSADPENGFFADGIHDDLLTRLADIDALHVISRTSVNEYRNTNKRISVIGEELGVTTIVEGAVQRSGDQVRVTVRLIDVTRDEQLWEQTYDRNASMQSVFELQTEISSNITASLRTALTPEERQRLASIPTQNMEAYKLFVGGKIALGERRFSTLISARQKFEQAIALDPDYAQAYAALAETVMAQAPGLQTHIGCAPLRRPAVVEAPPPLLLLRRDHVSSPCRKSRGSRGGLLRPLGEA